MAPDGPVKVSSASVDRVVPLGPPVIVGPDGATWSTVIERVATGPRLPAGSVARAWWVWFPSGSADVVWLAAQGAKLGGVVPVGNVRH